MVAGNRFFAPRNYLMQGPLCLRCLFICLHLDDHVLSPYILSHYYMAMWSHMVLPHRIQYRVLAEYGAQFVKRFNFPMVFDQNHRVNLGRLAGLPANEFAGKVLRRLEPSPEPQSICECDLSNWDLWRDGKGWLAKVGRQRSATGKALANWKRPFCSA